MVAAAYLETHLEVEMELLSVLSELGNALEEHGDLLDVDIGNVRTHGVLGSVDDLFGEVLVEDNLLDSVNGL